MRSLTGLFLLLAGIAVGAQAYYPDTVERHIHIAQLARVLTPSAPYDTTARDLQGDAVRSFSPGQQLLATRAIDQAHAVKTVEQTATPILDTAPKLVRTNSWEANVIRTAAAPIGGEHPLTDSERWRLVRDLQSELRRAGCYWGKLDGSWGAGSKYAFQEFLMRVNAALPTTTPDPIMLTLVRSHPGTVCGKSCDDGFTKSANGRCLPYAITAEKHPAPETNVVAPPARLVRSGTVEADLALQPVIDQVRPAYPEGRMAVGAPVDQLTPYYAEPGLAAAPSVISAAPRPEPYVRYDARPASKTRKTARAKNTNRTASSKSRRRKALIRQAFGEGFD